jgi:hypothetical protein
MLVPRGREPNSGTGETVSAHLDEASLSKAAGQRESFDYDAFISYTHRDRPVAAGIQKGLHRIGRRVGRLHALRVFRDATDLSASPDLWGKVTDAMDRARYLIVVLSPHAVASKWVNKEVAHWLQRRGPDRLMFVVAGGRLTWDEDTGRFDPGRSDVAPPVLMESGVLTAEPFYVDVSEDAPWDPAAPIFREKVTDLAAPIHGKPKYELASEDVRELRRFRRLRRAAIAGLAILTVLALVAAALAVVQRNRAVNEARIALSRQLSSTSGSLLTANPRAALLLAVDGYRTDANPQTLSALMRANLSTPKLLRYFSADADIARVEGDGDGKTVVAGLVDGRVVRWRLGGSTTPETVGALAKPIASLTVASDASVIAASDGARSVLWRRGAGSRELTTPAGQRADIVAVSPSGRTAVVHGSEPIFGGAQSVSIYDVASGKITAVHEDPLRVNDLNATSTVVMVSDAEVLFFDAAYGDWQRRRIPDWSMVESSSIELGVRQRAGAPAANGGFLTAANGAPTIPVWSTAGPTAGLYEGSDQFTAQAPISDPPGPLALSPDGTRLAVADRGSIYVAPVAPAGAPRDTTVQLSGAGAVGDDLLGFFADNTHLLSAAGRQAALWDLDQIDRLAKTTPTPLADTCRGCDGARLSISPDNTRAVITDDTAHYTIVQPLPAVGGPAEVVEGFTGAPLWTDSAGAITLQSGSPPTRVPSGMHAVPVSGDQVGDLVAAALRSDGHTVVAVTATGAVYLVDKNTGSAHQAVAGPAHLAAAANHLRSAALDSAADVVAFVNRRSDTDTSGSVTIIDVAVRASVGHVPGDDVTGVAFAGSRLLVQRIRGALEVWDQRGSRLERVIAGDKSFAWPAPVGDRSGTKVARQSLGGEIDLVDLDTGSLLGVIAATPVESNAYQKTSVAFSPDGSRIVTVTNGGFAHPEGVLIERHITPESLIAAACAAAGSDLSSDEWTSLVGQVQRPRSCG